MNLTACTISGNSASVTAVACTTHGTATLTDTIVAGNTSELVDPQRHRWERPTSPAAIT